MSMELFRDRPLFEANLDVCIQAGPHGDAKTLPLTFRILDGLRQQQTSSQQEKIFHFELTDESDPFYLYVLDIGEYDFHNLKRDQCIIVDFLAFPSKLISLLQTCSSRNGSSRSIQGSSTFKTTLDATSGLFSVVEANEFKNLTHISLQLRPANDATIKMYLAARLHMSLDECNKLRQELQMSHETNQGLDSDISQLNESLLEMRSRLEHEVITLKAAHSSELSELKVSHSLALNSVKSEMDHRLATLREQSESQLLELREELDAIQEKYSASDKKRSEAEYRIRELKRDFGMAAAERDRAELSSKQYANILSERDASILKFEREIAQFQSKVESLKQQLKDKEEVILHAVGEKQAAEAARVEADDRTEMYRGAVEAMQEKLVTATSEMQRGNQIIKSQSKEIDELKERIRGKNEVIRRQESAFGDIKTQNSDLSMRLQSEMTAKATEQQRVELLTREVEAGKEKIAASLEALERNKEIINHLNDMITALQMGGSGGHSSTAPWSTPPGANSSSSYGKTSGGVSQSYGFRVMNASTNSPDGFAGLYDGLSPPLASSQADSKVDILSSDSLNKWRDNKAMMDTVSTKKYNILRSGDPGEFTPASTTSGAKAGVEMAGYYRGLPVGQTTLTPSITGETPMFLRGSRQSPSGTSVGIRATSQDQPKYHWQSENFGLEEELEMGSS